jgi:hypothetical protein
MIILRKIRKGGSIMINPEWFSGFIPTVLGTALPYAIGFLLIFAVLGWIAGKLSKPAKWR